MSVSKQEGKVSTLFSLGAFVEDGLEKYKRELYGLEGTKQALAILAKKLEEYIVVVDQELEIGKISMSEANVAKRHVATCVGVVRELLKASESQHYQAQGKISASDRLVVDIKKMFDEESLELDRLRKNDKKLKVSKTRI